ncbi:nuclear transport factor 2 family protein, partial [Vibrio breoganii]
MDNSLWLDNFLNMYRELGTDNFDVLKTVYHPDIEFQDPLHHVSG